MVTSENLQFCFDNLNKKEIKKAMDSNKDFIKFELHIFNAGGFTTIKAVNYSAKKENRTIENGNIFCDKSIFLGLFIESEATNKHLKKYI